MSNLKIDIIKMLKLVSDKMHKSISFPQFHVDKFGSDIELSARITFDGIKEFSKKLH